ncbi:uncharacterized protein LOC18019249 [Eutrema salsugineum]|uniref:uncharacterized protein LOC18019249 n=1 Tax=Eutrema salsugineum TaxID=72664 RepID=UPI000CED4AC9|nr:uncharacterized protein LOC18019249 [Eutrema salsugineum]
MTRVSQLTLIFRDKLQTINQDSNNNSGVVEKIPSESSWNHEHDQLKSESALWPSFQMPLHYPNFTKEQYEIMSEKELDRLLKLYGLPTDFGDLSCKKQFAFGAFLWEKGLNSSPGAKHDSVNPNSSVGHLGESSLMGLMTALKYMVHCIQYAVFSK